MKQEVFTKVNIAETRGKCLIIELPGETQLNVLKAVL